MMLDHRVDRRVPAGLVSIDDVVNIKSRRPAATSRDRGWRGVTIDLYRAQTGVARSYPALDHHVICYCPSGSARLVQRRGGAVHDSVISAGMAILMPANCASIWEGDTAASARLRVPTALVAAAGEQMGRTAQAGIELRNVFETRDAAIERMALLLLAEVEQPLHPAQALIVDQISMALAAHLVRAYAGVVAIEPPVLPALGRFELARLTEFIEENIDQSISLAELADLVNVSRFHFTRLFKRSTGITAMSFVERCRIRRAQALIQETDLPLAEIALMTGFADQSHFTRRFHRHVGDTPASFARDSGRRRGTRRGCD